jgi:predicted NBD/HSP70 family sugar kinase
MKLDKSVFLSPTTAEVASGELLAQLVRDRGRSRITRTGFKKASGLSNATVTRAVELLSAADLVRDCEPISRSGRGRPEVRLQVNPALYVLGISIVDEPEQIRCGLVHYSQAAIVRCVPVRLDAAFEQTSEEEWVSSTHTDLDLEALVDAVVEVVRTTQNKIACKPSNCRGIGIMLGGHSTTESITYSPNIAGHTDIPLSRLVRDRLRHEGIGLPDDLPVVLDNDANALARRYYLTDEVAPPSSARVILKYDGIGCAIVREREVAAGAREMAAELGHLPILPDDAELVCRCGNTGCLEQIATPVAVARRLALEGSRQDVIAELVNLLDHGDDLAHKEMRRAAHYFGIGLASLVNLTDPGTIIIQMPDEFHQFGWYQDAIRNETRAHVYKSARAGLKIDFDRLPSADEAAAAGATRVIERIVRSLGVQMQGPGPAGPDQQASQ